MKYNAEVGTTAGIKQFAVVTVLDYREEGVVVIWKGGEAFFPYRVIEYIICYETT